MLCISKKIKKLFQDLFQKLGINITIQKPNYHYVPDFYGRTAYKHINIRSLPEFSPLADSIIRSGKTSHYYDRLYTIYQSLINMSQRFRSTSVLNIAEVGVYKGGTSRFIAETLESLHVKRNLHCFDTFEGHASEDIRVHVDDADQHKPKLFNDTDVETVKQYLGNFNDIFLYKGRFQQTCSKIEAYKFHFVHIDMDLYDPILFALNYFENRLFAGSILIIDDYGFNTCPGAKKAVDEFMASSKDFFGMHLLTGQYLLVKTSEGVKA